MAGVAFGGMLASAVLKVVVKEIATIIKDKIMLQKDFEKHLEEMMMTLTTMEAVLKDAERRSIKEATVHLWLERLKKAMYDISDMIDEFQEDTNPAGRKWPITPSCCLAIGRKISMADKMETMRGELQTINIQHAQFNFMLGTTSEAHPVSGQRETTSTMEDKIIPRQHEEKKMIASLYRGMTENFTILPIYGIGGIGKTTMARKVFNHFEFRDYSKVWVYVSQTFDLKKIGNSIISQLLENARPCKDMQMINNSLTAQFTSHKETLIVLDDLWENKRDELQDLHRMLKLGEGRKVVVVTTRDKLIAKKIGTIEPHRVAPLTVDMCWDIIKQQSEFASRGGTKEYEDIGKGIAMKCGGVALAAQSLGYMLRDICFDRWVYMKDDDIWNVSVSENTPSKVLASLRLSYMVMPPLLKLCFAYCAIFPKGHKIIKDDLIYQWASLGIIEPPGPTWVQMGEVYIGKLLGLSFLQHSKTPLTSRENHEDVTLFTMHDLVHDLACSVMGDEILVASKPSVTCTSGWHYALLNDCSKPSKASIDSTAKVRALRFMDCEKTSLEGAAFSSARYLRVLDLSQCSIPKLPDCIGRLKQLRYLHAPGIRGTLVPDSITVLSKLIYLSFRGSSRIVKLPDSFGKLEGLLYLDLSECSSIGKLPESLARLINLKYLNLSGLSAIIALPELIGDMKSLVNLDLSGCKMLCQLPASIAKLTMLVHLDLSHCRVPIPEALSGFTKLQHLDLSHLSVDIFCAVRPIIELPKVIRNLVNLRYLNLSRCMSVMDLSKVQIDNLLASICTLSNLEHLDMSGNSEISSLPETIENLQKLHTLDLLGCYRIQRLPESMAKMKCLKVLNVKDSESWLTEPSLSKLNILSLPHLVVSRGEYNSNLILLRPTNPDGNVEISGLENVMSAEEAERVELVDKNRIDKLTLRWREDAERTVDDKEVLKNLVPPSSLRHLMINGYTGDSIPNWMMGIGHYLPNLSSINLGNFRNCNNLPPFGQLPNLASLGLCRMDSIEKWNMTCSSGADGADELMFPKLQTVQIQDCPKLTIEQGPPRAVFWTISNSDNVLLAWAGTSSSSSPSTKQELNVFECKLPLREWRLLQHLPALRSLTIRNPIDLAAPPEIIHQLSSLQSLSLWVQAELPTWLFHLTSLQELSVQNPNLDGPNEQARQLKQLQSLCLSYCKGMSSEPQWLGELTSLEKLIILNCREIRSFPESIRDLKRLEYLSVYNCPDLSQWCVSDDNKMKLAHIKDKIHR